MEFKKFNANPKEWKHEGDCVIRAITTATGKKWLEVYKELFDIGYKKCRMPNSQKVYEDYLGKEGWVKQKMPVWYDAFGKRHRYTVRELIEEHPDKRMIISVANHLTFADKGTLIDTWNCGSKSVGNYWTK